MARRLSALLPLLFVVAAPTLTRAADEKAAKPAFVIRVQSIDDVRADIRYLGKLVGQEEQTKQFDELIKSQLGDKGLEGIDTKKPLGLYGWAKDISDLGAVVLVPVSDEKAFLDLVGRLGSKPEKGEGGIYSTTPNAPGNQQVYFRFAHQYAYLTALNANALAKDLLADPATVLAAQRPATLSVAMHLGEIPDGLKDIGLQQFQQGLEGAKDQQGPGETDAQHKAKGQVIDDLGKRVERFVKEATTLELRFNVNRKEQRVSVEASFAAKPGSELASNIQAFGETRSLFAGLMQREAAVNFLAHFTLAQNLRQALAPVIDEGVKTGLQNEKDENRRQEAERLLKALDPTIKAGELDVGFTLRGPDAGQHYTALVGLKLKDGRSVEKAVRDAARKLPERDRARIKWDAETVGRVKVHRADFQSQYDENGRRLLGDNPVYFAFRNDALVVALGPDGRAAIKELVAAEPAAGPQFELSMALAHLAPLMTKDNPGAPETAKAVFGTGGRDRLTASVRGGKALTARLAMDGPVIQFFSQLALKRTKALEQLSK